MSDWTVWLLPLGLDCDNDVLLVCLFSKDSVTAAPRPWQSPASSCLTVNCRATVTRCDRMLRYDLPRPYSPAPVAVFPAARQPHRRQNEAGHRIGLREIAPQRAGLRTYEAIAKCRQARFHGTNALWRRVFRSRVPLVAGGTVSFRNRIYNLRTPQGASSRTRQGASDVAVSGSAVAAPARRSQ